jgi:hypothetical protein
MDLVEEALQDKLPELAVSFFVVFSRFECAMKRITANGKPASPARVHIQPVGAGRELRYPDTHTSPTLISGCGSVSR